MTDGDNKTGSGSRDALHAWEEFVEQHVYPEPGTKSKSNYRDYDAPSRDTVRDFYRDNHRQQTCELVERQRDEYLGLDRNKMSISEALDYLNTLVDDSDPDTDLDQLQHLLQTSESIRQGGHERWFVLAGFLGAGFQRFS